MLSVIMGAKTLPVFFEVSMRTLSLVLLLTLAHAAQAATPDWDQHPENQWVKQSPQDKLPAPPFGWEGSGAYDPHHRQWIHHGGHDGIPQGFHLFTYDLNSGRWEQRFPNTSPPGVCCIDGANVFDLAHRRFVRFPGASLGHGYQWSRGVKLKNSAVWLYDPAANTWTNMRPPPYALPVAREGLGSLDAGGAYDPIHELAISFGGKTAGGGTSNLFAYDAYSNRLHRFQAENPPSPRDGLGITYDARNDCLVLFGSQYDNDERTWIYRYTTNRWEGHDLTPRPVGKKLGTYSTIPKMAFDAVNGVCLCLTWDTNTNQHETWAFDTAKLQWTKMKPPVEPEPSMSRGRNLGYSAEHNVFILESMPKEQKGTGPQIWTYRYKKAPVDPRPQPPAEVKVVTQPGKAVLSWTASPSQVKAYHVYRALADEPWQTKFEKLAVVPGITFEDSNLQAGKVYWYNVRAVSPEGVESPASVRGRTQPRVLLQPIVSVLAADQVAVSWNAHPAPDVVGYNVYRGRVSVRTVKKGTPSPWKDNDPEYAEPLPVEVRDITDIQKLNAQPLRQTTLLNRVDLTKKDDSSDYKYTVYAYLIKAVNQLGTESGPSPYALTIPSEPTHFLTRTQGGATELKWVPNPEKSIAGYRLYKLEGTWNVVRVTDEPVRATTFLHKAAGTTRYWVVAVDALGQEGQPSSPVWHNRSYTGFFQGEWHQ